MKDRLLGRTPLPWAVTDKHEGIVRLLLERSDFDSDSKDSEGITSLSWAAGMTARALSGFSLSVPTLIPTRRNDGGKTPLLFAVENMGVSESESIIRLLLERSDVDPDSKDSDGKTPLSLIVAVGQESIARLLLERSDVEPGSKDQYGRTPLSFAAFYGNENIVSLLLGRKDVEISCKSK